MPRRKKDGPCPSGLRKASSLTQLQRTEAAQTTQAAAPRRAAAACRMTAMAVDALEAKAHELLGQLDPGKLAAVVHLLEVMVNGPEEPVTEEDRRRFHEGQAWFAQRGGQGIPWRMCSPSLG